uniref:Uncharacterized protein n=1 Tax=Anguilla anguilla TaxID=7936 RepID=A0A0E9XX39_ANGAN
MKCERLLFCYQMTFSHCDSRAQ